MKEVKRLQRQLELAHEGNLFISVNCKFIRVDRQGCLDMQGVRFYTDESITEPLVTIKRNELQRIYKKACEPC